MANKQRLIDANNVEFALTAICNKESGVPLAVAEWLANVVRNAPTVDAVPVPHNPCGFCGKFEFDSAKAVVGQHGAGIVLACASTRYPIEEQFNFCPVCGRSLKEGVEDAAD